MFRGACYSNIISFQHSPSAIMFYVLLHQQMIYHAPNCVSSCTMFRSIYFWRGPFQYIHFHFSPQFGPLQLFAQILFLNIYWNPGKYKLLYPLLVSRFGFRSFILQLTHLPFIFFTSPSTTFSMQFQITWRLTDVDSLLWRYNAGREV